MKGKDEPRSVRKRGQAVRLECRQELHQVFSWKCWEPLDNFEQREAFLKNHGLHMKDGMEQERSWRQGGIHNRSVKKGEVPELGQWWAGKKWEMFWNWQLARWRGWEKKEKSREQSGSLIVWVDDTWNQDRWHSRRYRFSKSRDVM